ncbi:hypothetical protein [Dongia sp.]|uniref:hypothetical protein n=1 Tax=Dongia sp. TaxID=1977262 RepID=UPI0035B18341
MSDIIIGAFGVGGYTAVFWLADSVPCLLLQRHDRYAGWRSLVESCVLAGFVMTGRLIFDWPWTEVSALSRMFQMRDAAILPVRPEDKVHLLLRAAGSALGVWLMVFNLP